MGEARPRSCLRIDEPHVRAVPLHVQHTAADPAGRRTVLRGADLDTSVEMHDPLAVSVVPKGLDGQPLQMRLLLGKH